jgi:hypothetical protein
MRLLLTATCAIVGIGGVAHAQQMVEPASNDEYMKRVMQAAPAQVVNEATVMRMQRENGDAEKRHK